MNRFTKGKGLFGALAVIGDIAAATFTGSGLGSFGNLHTAGTLHVGGALDAASINLGGVTIKDAIVGTLSVVTAQIAPGGIGTVAVAVAGLAVGDIVIVNMPAATLGCVYGGCSVAAGTLSVLLGNPSSSGTIASGGTLLAPYLMLDLT